MPADNVDDRKHHPEPAPVDLMTGQETAEAAEDAARREAGWQEYRGYKAYEEAKARRLANPKMDILRYPQATLIAQIRIDEPTGEAKSGHDYNPAAQSHADTEAEFNWYHDETPPEQQLAVYEGGDGRFGDRDSAIKDRADAGLLIFLADQRGVERISGDPTPREELAYLLSHGVSREETALYSILRTIGSSQVREPGRPISPGGDIYTQLALVGVDGFKGYSREEKDVIMQQPGAAEQLMANMGSQAVSYVEEVLNPLMTELGIKQFQVGPDGTLTLPEVDGTQLVEMADPIGDGPLSRFARLSMECRDRHLFNTIADVVRDGKKPFVVFGGSHVAALRPVLDRYFNAAQAA